MPSGNLANDVVTVPCVFGGRAPKSTKSSKYPAGSLSHTPSPVSESLKLTCGALRRAFGRVAISPQQQDVVGVDEGTAVGFDRTITQLALVESILVAFASATVAEVIATEVNGFVAVVV